MHNTTFVLQNKGGKLKKIIICIFGLLILSACAIPYQDVTIVYENGNVEKYHNVSIGDTGDSYVIICKREQARYEIWKEDILHITRTYVERSKREVKIK